MAMENSLFINKVVDKNQLKHIIGWVFNNYGAVYATTLADKLKELGFHYATKAGLSLSIEDLRVPPAKSYLLENTETEIDNTTAKYEHGGITAVEKFQKVIDTWNNASDSLKEEVLNDFKHRDPLNPVYMMAFSGARGNISQVRQLVGMRGLMADPHGEIIDLPIKHNFREGLSATEYMISSYGARKGLVDTALRTADSGYLTRRLVDVAQDVIVREEDCMSEDGINLSPLVDGEKILISLRQKLLGRTVAKDLYSREGNLLAKRNQQVDAELAKQIEEEGMQEVFVRSPLTCASHRALCQQCYGWNLAHSRLVDLGEAVGIIAAQSIGEPGTQLTMRTFHTGGVFTGEAAQQIRASADSVVFYPKTKTATYRTRHGENALIAQENFEIKAQDANYHIYTYTVSQGSTLFVEHNQKVRKNQLLAEVLSGSRLTTETATKELLSEFSGEVYFAELTINEANEPSSRIAPKGGLIWILGSQVYHLSSSYNIHLTKNERVHKGKPIANVPIYSNYQGRVRFIKHQTSPFEAEIIVACKRLNNLIVYSNIFNKYVAHIDNTHQFVLTCSPYCRLKESQIFAEMIDSYYHTYTGGIIKYDGIKTSSTGEVINSGQILWIPEESHQVKLESSKLLVKPGKHIKAGTKIAKGVIARVSGIVEIIKRKKTVVEIIIKPGVIYSVHDTKKLHKKNKSIVYSGEEIFEGIKANSISYLEVFQIKKKSYLLVRPVHVYKVPEEQWKFEEQVKLPYFKTFRIIPYKDNQRIKGYEGVQLLYTKVLFTLPEELSSLTGNLQFSPSGQNRKYLRVNLLLLETLKIGTNALKEIKQTSLPVVSRLNVNDKEHISTSTIITNLQILSPEKGEVTSIQQEASYSRISLLTESELKRIKVGDSIAIVKEGQLISYGEKLTNKYISPVSGQVKKIDENEILIRAGKPYLISPGTILPLNFDHGKLIRKGEIMANLIFTKVKTGDIVQGLPKVEEILEARKPKDSAIFAPVPGKVDIDYTSDNNFLICIENTIEGSVTFSVSPKEKLLVYNGQNVEVGQPLVDKPVNFHEMLKVVYKYYQQKVEMYEAVQYSIKKIQNLLLKEIQLVYQSQSVDISDKHIEVIVRKMTSKVKIIHSGDTVLIPNDLVELQYIKRINYFMQLSGREQATYTPVLLGITKSSLNTESFISAASFQETTRVLAEAAIEGKRDWLYGLKENVVIGRLIPAGTGFYSTLENIENTSRKEKKQFATSQLSREEDIILDDRK